MPPTRDLVLRRRRLRNAVFGEPPPEHADRTSRPLRAVEGTIVDASPHFVVLVTADGTETRLPMSATTSVWYGGAAGPAALRAGRNAVVRPIGTGGPAADRIWVDIARVTGVIVRRSGRLIEVDAGPHRERVTVTIADRALTRIQVRHPWLEPGSLLDVIGIRRAGEILGLLPATAPQPASHVGPAPERPPGASRVLRGTATWYDHPGDVRGAAYPALDPYGDGGGCRTGSPVRLPYLSLGSEPQVRNDCTGRAARVPVIECGCLAARFRDRCVECGTSPRGRIVELTRITFVDLGGDLDAGCFNVTARVDHR